MGVHVADPSVRSIIDIGGQDVKGIAVDTDGTVLNFAMNDKCAAGTGRFFEAMAKAFEMDLTEFSKLALRAKNEGLKAAIEKVLKLKVIDLPVDPQLIGAIGAAEFARQKGGAA